MTEYVVPFADLRMRDVERVGGKNASLGEMLGQLSSLGIRVPDGFATTAEAFREFLGQTNLTTRIHAALEKLDVDDVAMLADTGARIREWILATPLPAQFESKLVQAWEQLGGSAVAVAVRSSATAEDLPDASFAGQQETFLNVRGRDELLRAVHQVFASLYTDRAIAYRVHQGFEHATVALSVGIQLMVRSDAGASGVMFTLDTESGFRDAILVTASYGLGEMVVQGAVNPDEFHVYKPALRNGKIPIVRRSLGSKMQKMILASGDMAGQRVQTVEVPASEQARYCITDADVAHLARQALLIEAHYGCPMDIEWGKDGITGEIYILQARPETVQSRVAGTVERFTLRNRSNIIISGRAIGARIGSGVVRVIARADQMHQVQPGDVLVADMTDPDWEPVMKRAAAIVTNRGGRTCHAAIIARELGIPAVVGCGDATLRLADGQAVTVACAEGDIGNVHEGLLDFEATSLCVDTLPDLPGQADAECRESRARVRLRLITQPWRGTGAAGVHHQPLHRRAPARAAGFRRSGSCAAGTDPLAHRPRCRAGGVFRGTAGGRHRKHCRCLCAGTRHRPAFPTSSPTNTPTCWAAAVTNRMRKTP